MGSEGRKQASILTDSQLKFLAGESDPSNKSQTRARIRERIAQGLVDFSYLFRYLDEGELRQLFGPQYTEERWQARGGDTEGPGKERKAPGPAARPAVPDALAFLAWGMYLYDEPNPGLGSFREDLEVGLSKFLSEKVGMSATVSVDIEVENVELFEN